MLKTLSSWWHGSNLWPLPCVKVSSPHCHWFPLLEQSLLKTLIHQMKTRWLSERWKKKRYIGLDDLFYTAAALEPRLKFLPFLTDHDAERTFTSITTEAPSLHNKGHSPTQHHLLNTKCTLQCILLVCHLLLSLDFVHYTRTIFYILFLGFGNTWSSPERPTCRPIHVRLNLPLEGSINAPQTQHEPEGLCIL